MQDQSGQHKLPLYMLCIMAVTMVEFLQNGMLNFAASDVMGGIGAGPEEFSYAAMAYASCAVLAISQQRRLRLAFGPRRLIRGSMLLFAAGAVVCGMAHGPAGFILGRAVQGIAAAAFFTGARVEVSRLAAEQRTPALLGFGYALLGGSALGPLLGSLALGAGSWRWLCFGILPWTAAGWLASGLFAETEAGDEHDREMTSPRLLWLAVAILLLQYLIQQLPYDFFSRPGWLLALLAGVLLASLMWLRRVSTAGHGARWRQLGQKRYLLGLAYYFFCYTMVAANSYIMPLLIQQGLGFSVPTTGLLLSVSFLAGMLFATVYAFLLQRGLVKTLRPPMVLGMLLLGAYGLLMSELNQDTGLGRLAAILLLNGGFMSVFIIAVAQGTFSAVEEGAFAHAYQTKNMLRQVALSSAVSLSTVFIQGRNALHFSRLSERFADGSPWLGEAMAQMRVTLPQVDASTAFGLLTSEWSRQTLMLSCLEFFRLQMWLGLAMALLLLWQRTFR
ncbi:hypothetical protein THUN1379_11570 [Paludibacterium sp. THUN1379]|uniref:MFS transporter n=1 Tax=Paludibacterium sp. THUN1379 TaxID=3112107 RepID=UPI00308ADC9E|nr:hypothetical protein THUN1379_11570 [Paludibacterium sp. THUN1379]